MCLAVPGRIAEILEGATPLRVARVDFGGIERKVNLAFVPEAVKGDYVLVHVGFAIARIDAAEAQKVFEYLRAIDAVEQELA
jgi:hydrogenase expression/formation protein HypC